MGTKIIIDGYNLIGAEKGLRGDIEARRNELISRLCAYQARKGIPITIVFDGWGSGWPDEHGEIRQGIEVVFSRHGEKADAVIIRMARELGNAGLIVSSDREISQEVRASGGISISISEFKARLETRPADRTREIPADESPARMLPSSSKKGNPRRLSKLERKRRRRLDRL